ncbi:MAG TPA: hypothetical protein VJ483_08945, partial [Holophagaceae bacterium]|nr:hypothetical protein [Holophagaceae bacterium]
MNARPLTLLLVACALGAPAFAERVDRDRSDRDVRNPHAVAAKEPEQDDATARRAAMREWWGDYTPEYRQFLMEAAAKERELNGALIPGSGHFLPTRAAGSSWTSLGPTSANVEWNGSTYAAIDSGRPVAIVVDPTNASIIYNATADGGVWKTTDGGTTWAPITEALGTLCCGSLTLDPSNHNTLYLGLGDSFDGTGIGVVKSTDGGATWSAPVFLGASSMVRDIKVSSTNNQVVLAATNAGLFRSTNGGASFSKIAIATGAAGDPSCWTLAWGGGSNWALSLESDTTVTTGSGQIWYSSDDGATWTKATGFTQATVGLTRASIASAPSNRLTMYAYAAGSKSWSTSDAGQDLADFYRSTDGGHTWTAFAVGGSTKQYTNTNADSTYVRNVLGGQAWYNQMIMVDPSNAATVYAGGNLALIKVTSATSTPSYAVMSNWLAQYSQPYIHADFHAGTIDQNGVMYVGTDGGIFKQTSAASNTWTSNLNVGIVSHLCYSVGSSLANRSVVIGGLQDNGTRVRSGSTSVFDQTLGGDGFGVNVHPTNASNMLGSLYYSRVYKSTTGGTAGSFAQATSGITEAGNSSTGVFITRITPGLGDATGNTVYTFSTFKVYKSTNYTGSWSVAGTAPISTGTIRNMGAAKSNTSVLGVVCSGGRAFLSSNGGSTWTAIPTTSLTGNGSSLSYISFSPANSNVVYIASVAPGATNTHLWRSTNFGSTWTPMDTASGFPAGIPVNAILEDPNDTQTLYAGTHQGVYRSIDGGSTWSRFGSGMPLVNVTDLYIAPDSSLVRASTFGRGFWELTGAAANTVTASITTPSADQTVASG